MNPTDGSTPLVLLHAFPLDSRMWAPQEEALGRQIELLKLDLPGFGEQPALDEEMLSMERASQFVREQLESRGVDRCVLAGLSMGGYVALECWRHFPEKIAGMILADTRAEADSEEARRGRYDALERIGGGHYEEFCEALLRKLVADTTRQSRPGLVAEIRELMLSAMPQNASAAILGMAERRDSSEVLATIDVPCLIAVGEHDALTPVDASRTMAESIPDAQLEIIPEAGHLSNMENPAAFNTSVARFLERLPIEARPIPGR